MKKIIDFLYALGLTDIEASLYQGLLETGPTTIMGLSQHTGIKRITTHFNIENLITKGLVTQIVQGARRQIMAEPPERLEYLVDNKFAEAKELQSRFPDFIKTVESIHSNFPHGEKTEVKYYEGKEGVMSLYKESIKCDEYYSYAYLDRYYEIFPDTNNMWNKAFTDNPKREVWDILIDSPLARKVAKETSNRYHAKFISKTKYLRGFNFSDYIIFDSKLAIVQLDNKNISATLIHSKHIALTLKAIHRTMWELLPK